MQQTPDDPQLNWSFWIQLGPSELFGESWQAHVGEQQCSVGKPCWERLWPRAAPHLPLRVSQHAIKQRVRFFLWSGQLLQIIPIWECVCWGGEEGGGVIWSGLIVLFWGMSSAWETRMWRLWERHSWTVDSGSHWRLLQPTKETKLPENTSDSAPGRLVCHFRRNEFEINTRIKNNAISVAGLKLISGKKIPVFYLFKDSGMFGLHVQTSKSRSGTEASNPPPTAGMSPAVSTWRSGRSS